MKKHRSWIKTLLTIILLAALTVVLLAMLRIYKQRQAAQQQALKQEAEFTNANSAGTFTDEVLQQVEQALSGNGESSSEATTPEEEVKKEETPTPTPTEVPQVRAVSLRGDDFYENAEEGDETYPQILQRFFDENGIDMSVQDNTWGMAGSLSQLALAGVPDDVIQGYISAHTAAASANGTTAEATDIRVRDDLDAKRTERDDLHYIPVVMIGYYGGWGKNVSELIDQEKQILATYDDAERYVIVGAYPFAFGDKEAYDEAHRAAFGDHYLSLGQETQVDLMSGDGRIEIARLIYNKMALLGYLS